MNRVVRLREETDRDLSSTASWYEQQRAGLGHEFLDDALSSLQRIAEQPLSHPVVHRDTRRALMTRFPFGVYYRVEQSQIVVVAIIHGSRHPGRWQTRT